MEPEFPATHALHSDFFTIEPPGKPKYPYLRRDIELKSTNRKNPGWIPGSERSAGKGLGYPLKYSWASLVVQLVKNPPSMQEIWVRSLGWEDTLEKRKAIHSSILA